ncbi:hypothetical protein AC477_03010 [miscellaneous Crenarchaeota group-1 archaeon SG8-32-1]|uniref:Uncharacterized protein n=1 Tax=miscellaneous Crenarchaeota group-1 archaeon SG8-32-1 TaxID=1685124 RepID=A0A0M0BWB9_9ARCH|nr:MAG: hypothetical protein AC477_03010 [miscellaneous Crenarchaeota group-1 archaeon SG8-32-1]
MSGSTGKIEDKLVLKDILDSVFELEDEEEIFRFVEKISVYFDDEQKVKKLKESATKKDFDLIVKTLSDETSPLETRKFAAATLAVIGGEEHEDILRDQFSKDLPGIRQKIFKGLLLPSGIFPIAPRLKLIFEFMDKFYTRERDYLKVFGEQIKKKGLTEDLLYHLEEEAYHWEMDEARFEQDVVARLRALSMNSEYKAEFAKYRKYFYDLLEDHIGSFFDKQNINFDVAVNAAKILYSIGLWQDIVEIINASFLLTNSRVVYLAGEYGEANIVWRLASQLEIEDSEIKDPFAWFSYCNEIIEALGKLGRRFSAEKKYEAELGKAVEPLCKMLCENIKDEKLSLRLLRAIEDIQGKIKTAEYVVSKLMEAEKIDDCGYLDILVLLKDKNAAFKELENYFFKGKVEEKRKAEVAIQNMGLSQAVDLLVTEELSGYYSKYIGEPMKEVETESLNILRRTVKQVESTYKVNTGMSVTVFVVGIIVIFIGAMLVLTGTGDATKLFGGASVIGGIVTTLTSFAKGPISSVQNAVADLAQVETAFLYYVRSTGLASFAFLREFLKEKKPDINILEKCTEKMNEVAKATMLLIEVYGGGKNETIDGLFGEKKDELAKAIMGTPTEPKTPTPTTTGESTTENPK